jgi:bromodomain-containing factor 1
MHSSPHPQSNEPNQYSSPLPQLPSSSHQEYDKPATKEEPRKKYDAHPLPTKYEAEPLQKPMENQNSGKASKSSRPQAMPVVHKPSMSREQLKHCRQIIKELKHHRDADPFAAPVDYVAMNLPDYPTIIKKPMDLQTAERKLDNVEYSSIDDFYDDIELIFSNCNLYNGLIAPVSKMAANLQRAFHKLKQQYSKSQSSYNVDDYMDDELPKSSKASKSKPKPSSRRSSASKAAPIKSDAVIPSGKSHVSSKSHSSKANNAAQLKYCNSIIKEFEKKSNYAFIFPFLDPVDPVALNIPDYPKIIKHPMDISTIKKKLSGGRYTTAYDFESDVRLMLKNCFTFNPPGTDVYIMGQKVEELFNNKWKSLPVPPPSPAHVQTSSKSYSRPKSMNDGLSSDTSDDEGYPSRDYQPSSAKISKHMKQLSNQIHSLKHSKSRAHESTSISPKKPSHRPKEKAPKQPQSYSSRPKSVPRPETNIDQNDREVSAPISYEEKKVLSDYINFLTPDQLATVVELIKQNMPQLQEVI